MREARGRNCLLFQAYTYSPRADGFILHGAQGFLNGSSKGIRKGVRWLTSMNHVEIMNWPEDLRTMLKLREFLDLLPKYELHSEQGIITHVSGNSISPIPSLWDNLNRRACFVLPRRLTMRSEFDGHRLTTHPARPSEYIAVRRNSMFAFKLIQLIETPRGTSVGRTHAQRAAGRYGSMLFMKVCTRRRT
jgi:hypothetical protein